MKRYILYLLPIPVLVLSVFIGPSGAVDSRQILIWLAKTIFSYHQDARINDTLIRAIIWDVRIPRILLAFLVGGALSSSGNALQSMFRNPLVCPYILGLSSGAAFGAALALATSRIPVQLSAFVFGILAVGISFFLARTKKSVSVVTMVLSGIVVSGIFTALLTIVQFMTDPFKLQTIVHWTMGNLHHAGWEKLRSSSLPIIAGMIGMFLLRWRMNVLSLGDDETRAVGLNPEIEKILILIPATMAASASVAAAGIIGLVGLVIPHTIRMMVGPDNTHSLPICFTFGGSFLLIVDNFSRTIASFEIPIGIFTTLIGGPFFIFLLKRLKVGWDI